MKFKNPKLKQKTVLFLLFFNILFSISLYSHFSFSKSAKELYHEALLNYREKNFSKSKELFYNALKKKENHPSILYNLALTEFQTKNYGMALALWRKTLSLFPLHTPTRKSLILAQELTQPSLREENLGYGEVFRNRILSYFTLNSILFSSFLLLFISGLLLLHHFKKKYQRTFDEGEKKSIVSFFSYFVLTLFLISSFLSGAKVYDHMKPRATIIISSTTLRLGPREEDNALLELKEGAEVIFREKRKKWLRVISSNGTMGWIVDSSAFQTSGKGL